MCMVLPKLLYQRFVHITVTSEFTGRGKKIEYGTRTYNVLSNEFCFVFQRTCLTTMPTLWLIRHVSAVVVLVSRYQETSVDISVGITYKYVHIL